MASSPRTVAAPAKPGLFAELLRHWLAHNRRLAQAGMLPL
jgi:hypothetical protein